MTISFIAVSIVLIATFVISWCAMLAKKISLPVSTFSYINAQFTYQLLLLGLTSLVLAIMVLLNKENFFLFFSRGDISASAREVSWLGIGKGETWLTIGPSITGIITLATILFMSLGIWRVKAKPGVLWRYIPWVVLFSFTNSFAEEVIYRLGVIVPLYGTESIVVISAISAVLFGLPHYRGMPSGLTGVVMAGILGWILAKSVIETQGIAWAWGIHFLQDIAIYSGTVILMYQRNDHESGGYIVGILKGSL